MKTREEIEFKINELEGLFNETIERANKKEISTDFLVSKIREINSKIAALKWVLEDELYGL